MKNTSTPKKNKPVALTEQNVIFGKNMEVLKTFEANYFHSLVTDSPYGLGAEPSAPAVLKDWLEKGYHEVKAKGGFMGQEWDSFVPQPLFWKEAYRVLKPGGYLLSFFGTRTYDWGVLALRLAGFEIRDCITWIYGQGFPKSLDIPKALEKAAGGEAVKEAQAWQGWGTGLKPAQELIVVARKPLSERTVAKNVRVHGTGGLNIDGCRIRRSGTDRFDYGLENEIPHTNTTKSLGKFKVHTPYQPDELGRFPSNVIFSHHPGCVEAGEGAGDWQCVEGCPVLALDRQSGISTSAGGSGEKSMGGLGKNGKYGSYALDVLSVAAGGYGDRGGASRFFYVAKATQEERNRGLEAYGLKNDHPTVKPVSIMRYLVRMVTPKFGRCLDPFNGTGTTGVACKLEHVHYVGIEQSEADCVKSRLRIAAWHSVDYEQTSFFDNYPDN